MTVIAVVRNNLQYNSFCLENMLYSMLMSDDMCVREEALKLILSLWEKQQELTGSAYNLKLKGVGELAATIRYSTHPSKNTEEPYLKPYFKTYNEIA